MGKDISTVVTIFPNKQKMYIVLTRYKVMYLNVVITLLHVLSNLGHVNLTMTRKHQYKSTDSAPVSLSLATLCREVWVPACCVASGLRGGGSTILRRRVLCGEAGEVKPKPSITLRPVVCRPRGEGGGWRQRGDDGPSRLLGRRFPCGEWTG